MIDPALAGLFSYVACTLRVTLCSSRPLLPTRAVLAWVSVKGLLSLKPLTAGHTTSSPCGCCGARPSGPRWRGTACPVEVLVQVAHRSCCPGRIAVTLCRRCSDARRPLSRRALGARKPDGEDAVRLGPHHNPQGTQPGCQTKTRTAPPCFLGLEPQDMMEGQCVGVPVCGWVMRLFVASSG